MSHPTDATTTFANLAVRYRLAAGLSQEQLAAAASLSVRAICDVERGATRRPQQASVAALADGLGLTGRARDAFVRAARQAPPTRNQRTIRGTPPMPELIGRDADVDAVAALLGRPLIRLVTVTGVTGVGKSAVVRHVARRVADRFDQVGAVDLSGVTDPIGVGHAVAAVLGAGKPGAAAPSRLLLLDGFRHGDVAALALADLLARHRALRMVLTATAPLKLRGEHVWPLAPLPVAATATLLAERTRAVRAGFRSRDEAVLGSLCRRLAGVPRAIELAALRLRTRDPEALDAELAAELGTDGPAGPVEVVRLMVAATVARLPAREAGTLAAVAATAGGITPAALRRALARANGGPEHVDVSVGALASLGLITVDDRSGRVHVGAIDPVAEILAAGPPRAGEARSGAAGRLDGVA